MSDDRRLSAILAELRTMIEQPAQERLKDASRDRTVCEPAAAPGSVDRARQLLRYGQRIPRAFGGSAALFGDPAWSILLDLLVAEADRGDVSISSACIASGAPATTGLRYIQLLEARGLVTRENDPFDRRRQYLRLTETARSALYTVLS